MKGPLYVFRLSRGVSVIRQGGCLTCLMLLVAFPTLGLATVAVGWWLAQRLSGHAEKAIILAPLLLAVAVAVAVLGVSVVEPASRRLDARAAQRTLADVSTFVGEYAPQHRRQWLAEYAADFQQKTGVSDETARIVAENAWRDRSRGRR